ARFEHGVVAAVEEWGLVALEADRVADVVADGALDAQLARQLNACKLDLAGGDAWRHHLDGARLQREHRVEGTLLLGGRSADDHRSLELAVVAVDVRPRTAHEDITSGDAVAHHEPMRHGGRSPADEHRLEPRSVEPARAPSGHLPDHLEERLSGCRRVT